MEQKALPIFMAALGMNSPQEREQYLDEACRDDPELRQRVEELLAAQEESDDFLIPEWMEDDDIMEGPGTVIGHYKLLEKIGEGGFGFVFMADQIEPIRRRVALKIVKPGMDTKQVIARFEAERQALALMDHPNIARVIDAGATESGRPYFVMELVHGVPITEYCDNAKLTREERIELFIPVCEAIQHAHQKGIIHRDIKPSNILVTLHDGNPVPKVIDFGTAKALLQPLTERTMFTSYGRFVGTPQYMSPEQAEMSGLDVDTRADIYSLGVLLYELLTGTTPFEAERLRTMAFDKMMHMIREEDPPKPSTRVSTLGERGMDIANYRKVDARTLRRSLQGDLDSIVMKALEKDRRRRYETAAELAMDLHRHLVTEPVVARPPSKFYEFQKTVRRHKVGFGATAGIIIVLFVGVVVSSWQATRATRAKKVALAAQDQAELERRKAFDLRQQAEKDALDARRRAYASDMNVAKLALDGSNLGRAIDLLDRQRPKPGEPDLRGWEWRYLWQQTRSDAKYTLCRNPDEIKGLAVSANGNLVAVGSEHGGGVAVWDVDKRREVIRLAEQEGVVNVAFSPTDPLLAFSGVRDFPDKTTQFTLHVWNTETRRMVAEFPLENTGVGLVFSPDGKTLITSTDHGSITLWSMPDGTQQARYTSGQATIGPASTPFAITPDLCFAAYGVDGGGIQVVDLRNGKGCWTAPPSDTFITALAFSSDGKILASAAGFGEKDILLWDVATGEMIGKLEGHGAFVSSILFWPDDSRLASSSGDQTIRIWDLKSRECIDVLRGHRLEVFRLALLPDQKTLVSGAKDGEVCLWDVSVKHPRQASIIKRNVAAWCFESNRSVLTLQDGWVIRWTGKDFGRSERVLNVRGYRMAYENSPIFSSDGRYLAFSSTNQIIQVWDIQHRKLLTELPGSKPLKFYGGGPELVCQTWTDRTLNVWDPAENRKTYSWDQPMVLIGHHPIAISPGGGKVCAIGWIGNTLMANLKDDSATNLNLNVYEVGNLAYSPDGKLLAASSHLGFVKVWDATSLIELHTLRGYLVGVASVTFSPDGKRLATGSDHQEALRIWDTNSWRDTLTLESDGASFLCTIFSPDGDTIGSLNLTGSLYLWQAPSMQEIESVEQYTKKDSEVP